MFKCIHKPRPTKENKQGKKNKKKREENADIQRSTLLSSHLKII
jgi:hypothetical protein